MPFRIFLLFVAACSWSFTLWMASHNSDFPEVLSRYSNGYFMLLVPLFVFSTAVTLFQFNPMYQWVHNKRHNLFLLIFSLVFSVGCVEFLIRMLDPIGISYYDHSKNYHLDKIADDELYYRHKPHLDQVYQGVSVKTNALGMRNESISEKKTEELRIMFLGDSVTFGWGVRQEDIFVPRVGDILEKITHSPVQTFNMGVGSYNTDNEHATLVRYGEKLKPDLVVLLYVSNDIDLLPTQKFDPWTQMSIQDKKPPEVIKLLLGEIWTYRLISHLSQYGTASTAGNKLITTSQGWKQSAIALQEISDYCNSADIPLFVFMYRMTPKQFETDIASELKLLSAKMNFNYADVMPWFKDEDFFSLVNSIVDNHPNAQGHAILAEGIASVIQQKLYSDRDTEEKAVLN